MGCLLQVGVNEQESLNWVEKKPVGTGRQLSPWGPQTTNSEASRRRLDAVFGVGTCWKDASSPKRPRRERRFQPQAWLSVRSHLPEGTVHQRPETSFKRLIALLFTYLCFPGAQPSLAPWSWTSVPSSLYLLVEWAHWGRGTSSQLHFSLLQSCLH